MRRYFLKLFSCNKCVLYNNDAFSIISLTMFEYFLADTHLPNILLMDEREYTVSATTHLYIHTYITNTILSIFQNFSAVVVQ